MEMVLWRVSFAFMIGQKNYELLEDKICFDPQCIMNEGKIVNASKWMKFTI
jgi:hypothetical protein